MWSNYHVSELHTAVDRLFLVLMLTQHVNPDTTALFSIDMLSGEGVEQEAEENEKRV